MNTLFFHLLSLLAVAIKSNDHVDAADNGASNQAHLVAEQLRFTERLTQDLYENPNECTSALGISMAFDLIYPSATGQSLVQFQAIFGFPEKNGRLQWADVATGLTDTYNGDCIQQSFENANECGFSEPTIEIANSVWVRDGVALDSDYSAVVGSLARVLDFDNETAGEIVNSWVEDSTNGLIDSIVDDGPLDPAWILLAINSLYLKASWIMPFAESFTSEDDFFPSVLRKGGEETKAHFMHMVEENRDYSDTALPGYQVLKLGFTGTGKSAGLFMIFVLPTTFSGQEARVVDVLEALPKLEKTRVAIALPKFKFESEYSDALMESLKAIGLVAPFNGELCVRAGSCSAFVDYIIQKTIIDVNEKGVEAAAVTAIGVGESAGPPPSQPKLFLCNHPFQFFIYDANEGVVLFEGRVANPGLPEGGVAAQLQAKHSNAGFWKETFKLDEDPAIVEITEGITNGAETPTDEPTDDVTGEPDATAEPSFALGRDGSVTAVLVTVFLFAFL